LILGNSRAESLGAQGSFKDEYRSDVILFSRTFQGEKPLDTGGGRVFSLDASFGLLATASASALALFLGSALSFCGVSCIIC